jgi:hypothetical protein
MDIEYPSFGTLVIDGRRYDHDVVIEDGKVTKRDKSPSKALKGEYGHTPLSGDEAIPWSRPKLVIGSGYSGRLPVLAEIEDEAKKRGVGLVVIPTAQAVDLLAGDEETNVNAILHVTC